MEKQVRIRMRFQAGDNVRSITLCIYAKKPKCIALRRGFCSQSIYTFHKISKRTAKGENMKKEEKELERFVKRMSNLFDLLDDLNFAESIGFLVTAIIAFGRAVNIDAPTILQMAARRAKEVYAGTDCITGENFKC